MGMYNKGQGIFLPSHSFSRELLSDFIKTAATNPSELTFAQVPFNHPLFIMYSSGTTGVPKCMVHSVGVRRGES